MCGETNCEDEEIRQEFGEEKTKEAVMMEELVSGSSVCVCLKERENY